MMDPTALSVAAAAGRTAPLALVVEDDPHARRPIVELLKMHGMLVIESCDADEALQVVQDCAPNLVIADIMMRGKPEGFDLCWRIKTNPATNQSYVIMLTGLGEQSDVECGREHGADQYLVKPISMKLLSEIIIKLGVLISPETPRAH
jgi:twitching motility two-component system response regulator PilH